MEVDSIHFAVLAETMSCFFSADEQNFYFDNDELCLLYSLKILKCNILVKRKLRDHLVLLFYVTEKDDASRETMYTHTSFYCALL